MKQRLILTDMEMRVAMCQWFSKKVDVGETFLNGVSFSDEAHFL